MLLRLFFLLLISSSLAAQDQIHDSNGKIQIIDSVPLNGQPSGELFKMLSNWAKGLAEKDSAQSIVMRSGKKLAGEIALNLPLGTNTSDIGNYVYKTPGILTYTRARVKGSSLGTSPSFGGIRYAFNFFIQPDYLFFEFTDLEFSKNMVHFTRLEERDPPLEDGRTTITALAQKNWTIIRNDYTDFLKALSLQLKKHATTELEEILAATSPVNYENYKKISIGMSYAEVSALLADEGRELSNSQSKSNGKAVIVQSILWKAPRGDKTITINFENNKAMAKAQTGL